MVFKTFKRGSKRLAKGIGKEAGKVGSLAKKSLKTSFEDIKEERGVRKKAFRSARMKAIKSQASIEGRASVKKSGGFGIVPPMDIVFGPRTKKKKKGKKRENQEDAFFPF